MSRTCLSLFFFPHIVGWQEWQLNKCVSYTLYCTRHIYNDTDMSAILTPISVRWAAARAQPRFSSSSHRSVGVHLMAVAS